MMFMFRMEFCIIILILFCFCDVQPIYDFDVTLTSPLRSWSDVIIDKDCDVLGTEIPEKVSLSDIHVHVQGIQEESEVWIGSSVIYTPWLKVEVRRIRDRYRLGYVDLISSKTIKTCYDQCTTSFVISQSTTCRCIDPADNDTSSSPFDRAYFFRDSHGIMIMHGGETDTVYKPVDVPPDSSIGNCKTVWLSDGNISLQTTPCSSCNPGPFSNGRRPRMRDDRIYLKYEDSLSDDVLEIMKRYNITSVCVGAFRFHKFQWYNKDQPQNDPLHCVSAVVTNGRLSPRVRHCHTKLKAICVVGITRQKPDDDTTVTSTFLVALIVGAILEGILAIAMVIVFVVCMTRVKKMSNRFHQEHQPPSQNQQYSSLDHADRSTPPPAYDVLGSPEHYIALNQADRSQPSVYDVVSSQDHVYDEAGNNRTG